MTMKTKESMGPGREWVRTMAEAEEQCESVAVGGLAADLGMFRRDGHERPAVFGRLIEFARRARSLSVEELAKEADVELGELVAVEWSLVPPSEPRTIYKLAKVLDLPTPRLLQLAGLAEARDERLDDAAVRFAAQSEPTAKLSRAERRAFEEFVKVLAES